MRALHYIALLCVLGTVPSLAQPRDSRIRKLEELAWPQIDALDRERTMFILPIGMLEEHGPHLPVGSDTFGVEYEAAGVSTKVSAALPQWRVVMMPTIHYGETGANVIGGVFVHPGTYGIRHSTLRSLVADLGAQLAQNGFKWIFVLTGHASPSHGIAVNDGCDFVSETFKVSMLHVSGLFRADAAIQSRARAIAAKHFSAAEIAAFGLDVHAGVAETSVNLALQPLLVHRGYKSLPPQAGRTFEELQTIATRPGWQGYLSTPSKATAAYGRDIEVWWVDGLTELVLRTIRGENLLNAPRAPAQLDPGRAGVLERALQDEREFEAKLDAWLAHRRPR
ncbi:Creatinine amidohydrolase [Luteitalea pratensis]|uniref:Creatinine amidohydrolase n=1 Tax=Luteitalea pratensis TaxID=1855912 RepID=A0A143PFW2_LUTPR|nr:creatininase family protein [Luteitalea pratensis]AMY07411.1 Creatinine amidohydrolase [Luteitalea pratensis]